MRGKPKKLQVPPGEMMRNNTFVEDLQWKSGGHERMEVDDCIYPDDIRCKLSSDNDRPSPKTFFYKLGDFENLCRYISQESRRYAGR